MFEDVPTNYREHSKKVFGLMEQFKAQTNLGDILEEEVPVCGRQVDGGTAWPVPGEPGRAGRSHGSLRNRVRTFQVNLVREKELV